MLQAIRHTEGTAVAVTDGEIVAEVRAVTAAEGLFVCPEGAACFVAARRLREEGWLGANDEVVVLNTGTGLIYPDAVPYAVARRVRVYTIGFGTTQPAPLVCSPPSQANRHAPKASANSAQSPATAP